MKDIIEILERWTGEGAEVALGTVVERVGSAPRDPGAALAVSSTARGRGRRHGRLRRARRDPRGERGARAARRGRLVHYGLDDEDGFDVGLTCGGRIAVAVYRLDPAARRPDRRGGAHRHARRGRRSGSTRSASASRRSSTRTSARERRAVSTAARSLLEIGESAIVETSDGEQVFVESYAPRPNLYLFGASDHVAALVPIGEAARLPGHRLRPAHASS